MRAALAAVVLALLTPLALAAQTVDGALREPGTRAGVPGARVLLIDDGGRVVASALTRDDGTFQLRAPAGGRFTVRAERPGYLSSTSAPLTVGVGETARLELASNRAVLLPGVDATAAARCEVRPGEGTVVAAVWDEARKALAATRETSASGAYRFRVRGFARDIMDRAGLVGNDSVVDREVMAAQPYLPVPADTVAAHGFVMQRGDTILYNLPDAAILLSDAFLDTHCFRMAAGGGRAGEVGLAFEPLAGRTRPDVRGVFWLALDPVRLRSVEFEFTDPPLRGRPGTPGGALDFRALPNGRWIVSRWRLRMPLRVESARALARVVWERTPQRRQVDGVRETGGEVTAVFTSAGAPVAMETGATLAGVVWDSVAGRPLRGARVSLDGTQYVAETDSAGRYVLRDLPAGTFGVLVRAPRMDSLSYAPGPEPVVLARQQAAALDLAIPPLARLQAAACGPPAEGTASVSGFVRAAASGAQVPGARVIASWGEGAARTEREAATGPTGIYRLCGVPAGVPVSVAAVGEGGPAASRVLRLAAGEAEQHDLTLRGTGEGPQAAAGVLAVRVLTRPAGGEGVSGVRLSLDGTPRRATTDEQGMAAFTGVAPGRYTLVVESPGGGRFTQPVTLTAAGVALQLAMTEREGVYALAPVVGVARSEAREVNRRTGTSSKLVTRDQIAAFDGRPTDVMGMIRGFVASAHITYGAGPGGRAIPCLSASRGSTSVLDHSECNVRLVLDGIVMSPVTGAEMLLTLQPAEIESFEFLNSIDGALRFGTGGAGESSSYLVVHTRGNGPHRQQNRRN